MKISIIIATLNSERRIENAILSIINQSYKNIELIIIDGGSTDKTTEIIKKYQDKIYYLVSEKDEGISDAFNKGLRVSTGEYINFQGADDYLLENNVIEKIVKKIDCKQYMLICGKIERIKESDKKEVLWITPSRFSGKRSLLFKMTLPHQGLFTNKKFFDIYGEFDTKIKICMDYELLLRAYKNFPEVLMIDLSVSAWREGGIGANKTIQVYKEYFEIKKKNKIAPTWFLYIIYLWSIFKYFIKSILVKFRLR